MLVVNTFEGLNNPDKLLQTIFHDLTMQKLGQRSLFHYNNIENGNGYCSSLFLPTGSWLAP